MGRRPPAGHVISLGEVFAVWEFLESQNVDSDHRVCILRKCHKHRRVLQVRGDFLWVFLFFFQTFPKDFFK